MNTINPLKPTSDANVSDGARLPSNNQPLEHIFDEINASLPDDLARQCADLVKRTDDLIANLNSLPDVIENDDQDKQAADIIGQIKEHRAVLESRRTGIKAGSRQSGDIIDGFFKTDGTDKIDAAVEVVKPIVTAYKRRKAEEEKRRREEEQRKAEAEAEARRAAAAEALRKQQEAEAAKRRAEAEQKAAEEAAAKAKRDAAEAELRRLQAERDRAAAEVRAAAARDQEAREQAERDRAAAQRRVEDEAAAKQKAEDEAKAERERAATARTELTFARHDLADANKDLKTETSLAKQADGDANKAKKAVTAGISTMSGNRGAYGGQSSLSAKWVGDIEDSDKLDPMVLWPFVDETARKAAVDAFVKLNKGTRKLRGVKIYEHTDTSFR